ncbi:DOPA 4,5-dioxygenase family protein [Cyberlindnera jadinii NRRL Y-1542]|uniref:Dopa 4,5-dioxygenase n=1 Tax=Cyberlindnera jadinii (strain ATCC 18201 / CBS 1600 / BCRC 20928 / JCM 3617 / NBRC 0987 / NRRL Y-1542) TaxID=983966 RepID=A0A1E4S0A2_CYBJN|nr:dopa 4,5-dioxygenase [Cyberlindnera jadinii NRRL Y-1542]ODV72921.1 dopa 4,5-dioxygenase [Cyberlindnera jadinii NRRL Y-1542]
MSFHNGIVSFDLHTYFKDDDAEQIAFANAFKEAIQKEFADELAATKCRLFKTHPHQMGPHPDGYGMFESDTRDPATFLKLLNFYQLNHGPLSVLIHPRSGRGDLEDHTQNALWLGEKKQLKLQLLEKSVH